MTGPGNRPVSTARPFRRSPAALPRRTRKPEAPKPIAAAQWRGPFEIELDRRIAECVAFLAKR